MSTDNWLMVLILGAPILTSAILVGFRSRIVKVAGYIAAAGAAISLAAALSLLPALYRSEGPTLALSWVPAAGIELDLHVDWLTLPFVITEAAVTLIAVIYAWGYHHADERTPYFYALLMMFALGMAGTTLADDMFLFYTFWELMLVASCALILFWGDSPKRNAVALKYFIFTHFGSLLVLVALVMLYTITGNDTFSALRLGIQVTPAQTITITTFFLIGFCVKMAIFPLHLWLPDAHTVAPMPVTIMLAAAMLSMGTYGILRFPMSIFSTQQLMPFVVPMMVAGIISEIYGALMALVEQDIKRIVAYSSVSQMGYILFGLGTMTYSGIAGATMHVIYHAIVKALLFMVLGIVIHATGRRKISELGGLGRTMPLTAICAVVGALTIAGTPPLCIFDSEWLIFTGGFQTPFLGLAIAALFGSLLTVAYALWLVTRIFFGEEKIKAETRAPLSLAMVIPTVFLAVLSLIEGLFPAPIYDWIAHELTLILGGRW
ncbi:MAG: NADH-quinone oxidoreductase subunit M [Anaerolineales bacterium]|nr:MAG: NADH-quinone oxidoreductase subunit M [Anaerolineales bacterium]